MLESALERLEEFIGTLRERVDECGELLRSSEMMTRYSLVDPVLRFLGWNTEDPREVILEYITKSDSKPDYVLLVDGEKIVVIEAKKLGTPIDKSLLEKSFPYAYQENIPYFAVTDSDVWKIYDVRRMPVEGCVLVAEFSILNDDVGKIINGMLRLWKKRFKEEIFRAESETEKTVKLDKKKVNEFLDRLTDKGRALLLVAYEYRKAGKRPTKKDVLKGLREKLGKEVDPVEFTGIKSGLTRLAERLGIPPPLPTHKDRRYFEQEELRYLLRDEWFKILRKIWK